jgi:hypothetical protein
MGDVVNQRRDRHDLFLFVGNAFTVISEDGQDAPGHCRCTK